MSPLNILEVAALAYAIYAIHRVLGIAIRSGDTLDDLRAMVGSLTARTCAEFKQAHDDHERNRDHLTEYRITPVERHAEHEPIEALREKH